MLLHDLVRSKAESKLSFQEKEILSKILFKKNSTAETRDYSELVRALRGPSDPGTRDLQIFSLTLSQLNYLGKDKKYNPSSIYDICIICCLLL